MALCSAVFRCFDLGSAVFFCVYLWFVYLWQSVVVVRPGAAPRSRIQPWLVPLAARVSL